MSIPLPLPRIRYSVHLIFSPIALPAYLKIANNEAHVAERYW